MKTLTLKERLAERREGYHARLLKAVTRQILYMILGYTAGYVIMMIIALALRG